MVWHKVHNSGSRLRIWRQLFGLVSSRCLKSVSVIWDTDVDLVQATRVGLSSNESRRVAGPISGIALGKIWAGWIVCEFSLNLLPHKWASDVKEVLRSQKYHNVIDLLTANNHSTLVILDFNTAFCKHGIFDDDRSEILQFDCLNFGIKNR